MPAFLALFFGVLALDQATKIAVRAMMPMGREIPLLPIFSLTHVDNTGIAFGLFQERNIFFIALGGAVTISLFIYAIRLLATDRPSALAMAAVLGGALGNLIDRVALGSVTDFLDFYVGAHHWPVFNVADAAICAGAGFVALRSVLQWKSAPAGPREP